MERKGKWLRVRKVGGKVNYVKAIKDERLRQWKVGG